MKLLHTSDWHLGQQFFNYSRIEEHRYFLCQLADIVEREQPDIMVVSGDIYHVSNPSAEAVQLFVDGLLDVTSRNKRMRTFITAGNHDSALRLESDKSLWKRNNVTISGIFPRNEDATLAPEKFIHKVDGVAYIVAVPFVNPRFVDYADCFSKIDDAVEKLNEEGLPVVYMAHVGVGASDALPSGEIGIGGVDLVPLSSFGRQYDYLALGHIHKPMFLGGSDGRARYCGTPLAVSFDEIHGHGIDIVEIEHGQKPQVHTIEIEQQRNVLTIPAEPTPFNLAIEALRNLPSECTDYVCLNVLVDESLGSGAQAMAGDAVSDKRCRFCKLLTTFPKTEQQERRPTMTLSEFREVAPIDIAKSEFKRLYNADMSTDVACLLQSVIDDVMEDERK